MWLSNRIILQIAMNVPFFRSAEVNEGVVFPLGMPLMTFQVAEKIKYSTAASAATPTALVITDTILQVSFVLKGVEALTTINDDQRPQ